MRLDGLRVRAHGRVDVGIGLYDQRIAILTGPNGAGKTTCLEAVGWALAGPPHGEPIEFDVRAVFDTFQLTRSTPPHVVTIDGANVPIQRAAVVLAGDIGDVWRWDPAAYRDATPPKRREQIVSFLAGGVAIGDVAPRVAKIWPAMPAPDQHAKAGVYVNAAIEAVRTAKNKLQAGIEAIRAQLLDQRPSAGRSSAAIGVELAEVAAGISEFEKREAASKAETEQHRRAVAEHSRAVVAYETAKTKAAGAGSAARAVTVTVETRALDVATQLAAQATIDRENADARRDSIITNGPEAIRREVHTLTGWMDAIRWMLDLESVHVDMATTTVNEKIGEIAARLPVLERQLEAWGGQRDAATRVADAARKAETAANDQHRKAQSALATTRAELARLQREESDASAALEGLAKTADELRPAEYTEGWSEVDGKALEAARERQKALSTERDAAIRYEGWAGREAELRDKERAALIDRDTAGTAFADLQQLGAEIAKAAVGPVCEPASVITRACLGHDLVIDPLADWSVSVGGIRLEDLSESAQAVTMCALHLGVQSRRPGAWRVALLDRLEVLEPANRDLLIDGLEELIRLNHLDNCLIACVEDEWSRKHPKAVNLSRIPAGGFRTPTPPAPDSSISS